jgi:hypothetical protein
MWLVFIDIREMVHGSWLTDHRSGLKGYGDGRCRGGVALTPSILQNEANFSVVAQFEI